MAAVAASGKPLAELAKIVTRFPQVLINVRVGDKAAVASSPWCSEAVEKAEAELGGSGRVLLRPSGTEPVVRVMVEAGTPESPSPSPIGCRRSSRASSAVGSAPARSTACSHRRALSTRRGHCGDARMNVPVMGRK